MNADQAKHKWSRPAVTALAGVALLGVELFLLFLFLHFSQEKRTLDNQVMTGVQVLYGMEETDPDFFLLSSGEREPSLSSDVLHGWSIQIQSVLVSLSRLPFPWTLPEIRLITRLERTFERFFREISAPSIKRRNHLSTTLRDILSTRQELTERLKLSTHRIDLRSQDLGRMLDRIKVGIFGIGLAAFGLFSFSVLSHRNTMSLLKKVSDSESYLKTLTETMPTALYLKDADGRWLEVNRAGLDLFDLSGKIWQGRTDIELSQIHPFYKEALETCRVWDLEAWKSGKSTVAIESVPGKDGTILQLETIRTPIWNPDGSPLGLIVSAYDLTERIRSEEILEQYKKLFESATEGILIMDPNRKILDVNPAFSLVTGYSREEVLGQDPHFLHSGRQTEEFYRVMWKALDTKGSWAGEIWNRKKTGEIYCEYLNINSVLQNDRVIRYIGMFSDITKTKEDQERMIYLAYHDALTDLPNRRAFTRKIEEAKIGLARNPKLRFSVAILDLDGFKDVNDRLGHQAGDDLLVQVSSRLKGVLRGTDTLARLGGDEFGLILLDDEEEEGAIFDRVIKNLRIPFEIREEVETISGSMGVTFCPPDMPDADSLLSHADLALYRVKNGGRNGWALFQQEMSEKIESRHRTRLDLGRALSNGELVLHYQPQVNMTTGQVVGAEALVRWNHPGRGFLFPSAFIDVAEKSELIAPLGRFVMEEALSQQNRWKQEGLALQISVNIGARHFLSGSFHADLERVIARHAGSFPSTIEIEVTETEALRDLSHAQRVIEQCLDLGVMVSLDDFGTGETSLSVLQNLSVGEIKIDQGFVRGIAESQKKQAIASGLIAIGRIMQLKVVVEGIETEEEGLFMIRMGCELAQGYSIARAMPSEAIPEWIATWKPFESWTQKNLLGSAVNAKFTRMGST